MSTLDSFLSVFVNHFSTTSLGKRDPNHLYPLPEHSVLKNMDGDIGTVYVSFKIYHTLDTLQNVTDRKWFPKIYLDLSENDAKLTIKPPQLIFSKTLQPILHKVFREKSKTLQSNLAPKILEFIKGSDEEKPRIIVKLASEDLESFDQILGEIEFWLFGFCELWRELYHFRTDFEEKMLLAVKKAELEIQECATESIRLRKPSTT